MIRGTLLADFPFNLKSRFFGHLQRTNQARIMAFHTQQAADQRSVSAMSAPGQGKRVIQSAYRPARGFSQHPTRQQADAGRARGM